MTRLRIATFNLLHGRSLEDGSTDEAVLRTAARTLDADIVGLQEVDRHLDRSGGIDQPSVVAEALGAPYRHFVPTLLGTPDGQWMPVLDGDTPTDRDQPAGGVQLTSRDQPADGKQLTGSGQYGIAIVSRYPLRDIRVRRFPAARIGLPLWVPGRRIPTRVPDEPRAALAAIIDTPYGPITVVTTHLSFVPGWNVHQLRAIVGWVHDLPEPRLLVGDLNIPGPLPRSVSRWRQLARLPTYPASRPTVQFDHVLGSGIGPESVTKAEALTFPVSDHCALAVELALEPGSRARLIANAEVDLL